MLENVDMVSGFDSDRGPALDNLVQLWGGRQAGSKPVNSFGESKGSDGDVLIKSARPQPAREGAWGTPDFRQNAGKSNNRAKCKTCSRFIKLLKTWCSLEASWRRTALNLGWRQLKPAAPSGRVTLKCTILRAFLLMNYPEPRRRRYFA